MPSLGDLAARRNRFEGFHIADEVHDVHPGLFHEQIRVWGAEKVPHDTFVVRDEGEDFAALRHREGEGSRFDGNFFLRAGVIHQAALVAGIDEAEQDREFDRSLVGERAEIFASGRIYDFERTFAVSSEFDHRIGG